MELFSYEECWTNSPTNGVGLRARCMPISYGHLLPAPKKWVKNRLGKEDVLWPTESDISRVQMREKGDMECTRRLQWWTCKVWPHFTPKGHQRYSNPVLSRDQDENQMPVLASSCWSTASIKWQDEDWSWLWKQPHSSSKLGWSLWGWWPVCPFSGSKQTGWQRRRYYPKKCFKGETGRWGCQIERYWWCAKDQEEQNGDRKSDQLLASGRKFLKGWTELSTLRWLPRLIVARPSSFSLLGSGLERQQQLLNRYKREV